MLTSDRVNPELLCSQWLPRRCHVGWLDVSFRYIARVVDRTGQWEVRTAREWGTHAWEGGHARMGEGHARLGGGTYAWKGGSMLGQGGAHLGAGTLGGHTLGGHTPGGRDAHLTPKGHK
jgi:hypothetical protein